ncbi:MAG: hypothetical protein ABEH80_05795 [Halobaculum sp.]
MSDRSGTSRRIEERKLTPDPETADSGPLHRFLVDSFDASAEVLLLSMPFFTAVVLLDDAFYTFRVTCAIAGLIVAVAALRGNRLHQLPRWPSNAPRNVAVRAAAYNLVVPVAVAVGGFAGVGPGNVAWASVPVILPAVVTAVVAGVVALSVPSLVRVFGR